MRAQLRVAVVAGCLAGLLAIAPRAGAVVLQPQGTFNQPLFVTSPPDDQRLFVVERGGFIQVRHDGTWSQFLDISGMVRNTGEQGFLSMAFDPNYAVNGLFYVFFTDNGTGGAGLGDNHVDEFKVSSDPNVADPASRRQVLVIDRPSSSTTNHNGGQLQFGPDGMLYISVGDDANGANAQSLGNPHGKILRIDPHGATPGAHGVAGNPFVGTAGAIPEIWSLGLRNPFRFSFDHETGDLVVADVGNSSWEEIDFAPTAAGLGRGTNFGWPNCEGFTGTGCGTTYTNPVFAYPHSDPGGDAAFGCAIIGGYVYRGNQIPELSGRYLYADLCTGELRSIQLGLPLAGGDRAESAQDAISPNSFGEDSSCELYVTNGNVVDKIVGSSPASVAPACQPAPATTALTPVTPVKKKKCRRHKKHKKHAAVAKKKRKKCKRKRKHRDFRGAHVSER